MGDLLDLHPPFGRGDQKGRGAAPVDQSAEVILLRDIERLRNQNFLRHHPLGTCLLVDHLHSDQSLGHLGDLLSRLGEFHPARFPPPARMDLDLHNGSVQIEISGDPARLFNTRGHPKVGDGHPEFSQYFFRLIFM